MKYDIAFPNLGIFIEELRNNFTVFNYTIAYYGVIIALAMIIGFFVVLYFAKKSNQSTDEYYDLFIYIIIAAIVGARAYYVAFNWDYYQLRPSQILNIRAGGLAIYGGIIASLLVIAVFCFIKRLKFFQVVDTMAIGLAIGQVIGRIGNFFNMEAFGTYTNNIFAMRMRYDLVDKESVDVTMLMNKITENGVDYVQAHPTFFYEASLNLILFIILIIVFLKLKKFNGQIMSTYFIGYGLIRFFLEGLRTDSLMIANTNIRVSQALSLFLVILGILIYTFNFSPLKKKIKIPERAPSKNSKEYANYYLSKKYEEVFDTNVIDDSENDDEVEVEIVEMSEMNNIDTNN